MLQTLKTYNVYVYNRLEIDTTNRSKSTGCFTEKKKFKAHAKIQLKLT